MYLTEKTDFTNLNHQIISKEVTMKKYFIFTVIVLLIIGCNSKETVKEQKLIDSLKSEEKVDSIAATEPEPTEEKTRE